MSQENIQIASNAFTAAMSGDVETVQKLFTPDAVLTSTYPSQLPFSGEAHGPAEIMATVQKMPMTFEASAYDLKEAVVQGDSVIMIVEEHLRAKPTDKHFKMYNVVWAKVRDGRVYFGRIMADTFAIMESLRSDEAPPRAARPKKNAVKNSVKNALKAATQGKPRAGKAAGKNALKAAKKPKAGARKSATRARR